MTPEGRLLSRVTSHARSLSLTVMRLAFRTGVAGGWPDLLLFIPGGRPLLLEFKRPGQRPTPLQQHRLETLNELGYNATWCDSFDQACAAITQAMDTAALHGARSRAPDDSPVGRPRAGPGLRKTSI